MPNIMEVEHFGWEHCEKLPEAVCDTCEEVVDIDTDMHSDVRCSAGHNYSTQTKQILSELQENRNFRNYQI